MARVKMEEKAECKIIQPDNAGAPYVYTATSIQGLVGNVTFDVSGPRRVGGKGTERHRLSVSSTRVSIYSRYIFPSHPDIDWNVRCNRREHIVPYRGLCYPDSIQGYNPIFQTKHLVNIRKELLSKACDNSDCPAFACSVFSSLIGVWVSTFTHQLVHWLFLSVLPCLHTTVGVCACAGAGAVWGDIRERGRMWKWLPLLHPIQGEWRGGEVRGVKRVRISVFSEEGL